MRQCATGVFQMCAYKPLEFLQSGGVTNQQVLSDLARQPTGRPGSPALTAFSAHFGSRFPGVDSIVGCRHKPNKGNKPNNMTGPHTTWVSTGANTPAVRRRSSAHTVPSPIAAQPSMMLPLAITAPA